MIRGMHGMFYSSQAEAMREFLRDKVGLPYTDVGQGWLIFDLPEADLGVHPIDDSGQPPSGTADLSFYCDDIESTVADLRSRGVEFDGDVADHGYGLVTYFRMPGDVRVQLYQPRYQKRAREVPADRPARAARPARARPAPTAARKSPARRATAKASKRPTVKAGGKATAKSTRQTRRPGATALKRAKKRR